MERTQVEMLKYLFAGGVVVAVNASVLYTLTQYAHIYYLMSAVLSFCVAFLVSFFLQKYWTFQNRSTNRIHEQAVKYLLLQLGNLATNTALLYLFVEYAHLWYITAQLLVSLILAVATFIIIRRYIFVGTESGDAS